MKKLIILLSVILLSACSTKGNLEYVTSTGELKTVCETEYTGAPSVDKYAVEYILSYCARKAADKGYEVVDKSLLTKDLTIPVSPSGNQWTFEYATELHRSDKITDKEYGYIIAYIDLGLIQKGN